MKYLAIDTSGKNLTVVLSTGKKIYKYYDKTCGTQHSIKLNTTIEDLIEKSKFNLGDVDFFACVVGAGSFTGIRIGVATIKAFCLSYNKKALAITSFDTIAYNKKGNNLAVIDAGHNGYYVAGYNDKMEITFKPEYIQKEKLIELEKEYTLISGEKIEGFTSKKVAIDKGLIRAIESKEKQTIFLEELSPLYLRKSQAEEGR